MFDAGRTGVKLLLTATGSADAAAPQDRLIDLLAGTGSPSDSDAHPQMVQEMIRILEAQRIVSLNTLFELADNLESLSRGGKLNTALVNRLASRVSEIQLPRSSLTTRREELRSPSATGPRSTSRAAQAEPARGHRARRRATPKS